MYGWYNNNKTIFIEHFLEKLQFNTNIFSLTKRIFACITQTFIYLSISLLAYFDSFLILFMYFFRTVGYLFCSRFLSFSVSPSVTFIDQHTPYVCAMTPRARSMTDWLTDCQSGQNNVDRLCIGHIVAQTNTLTHFLSKQVDAQRKRHIGIIIL